MQSTSCLTFKVDVILDSATSESPVEVSLSYLSERESWTMFSTTFDVPRTAYRA